MAGAFSVHGSDEQIFGVNEQIFGQDQSERHTTRRHWHILDQGTRSSDTPAYGCSGHRRNHPWYCRDGQLTLPCIGGIGELYSVTLHYL